MSRKIKAKKVDKARNWGFVHLYNRGGAAHTTKKGARGYNRKSKHGKGWS